MGHEITPTKSYPLRSQTRKLAITTPALIKTTSGILEDNESFEFTNSGLDKMLDHSNDDDDDATDEDEDEDEDEDIYTAEAIVDSKIDEGVTYYRVKWKGYESDEDSWEPEENILDVSLINSWKEALQTGAKAKLRSHRKNTSSDPDWKETSGSSKKPKSKRKTRDVSQVNDDQDIVISQEIINTPRKRVKREGKSESPKTPKTPKTPRKSELLKMQHEQEVNDRIESRLKRVPPVWDGFDYDMNSPDQPDISCCMVCAAREFKRAVLTAESSSNSPLVQVLAQVEQDKIRDTDQMDESEDASKQEADHLLTNIPLFDKIYLDTKNITYYLHGRRPDVPYDTALTYAILRNQFQIVRNLLHASKTRISPDDVASGANNYRSSGHVSRFTFGHAVSMVKEARGNREGDSAFYQQTTFDTLEVHNKRKVVYNDDSDASIVYILRNSNLTSDMVKFLMVTSENVAYCLKLIGVYEAAAAGNREAALALIKEMGSDYGFNHLHEEVLALKDDQPLSNYRRNQILKMATENNSINPLQLAALNPDVRYLQELYENLTSAEVLQEDSIGRTVAHFAVVCDGIEPLKFLIEKKHDLTKMDLHRVTPLLLCAKYGKAHCIPLLLANLPDESVNETRLTQGWTALHFAAHYGHSETIAALIDGGANVEVLDRETKATPLFHAVKMGHLEAVVMLMEKGQADPEKDDKFKRKPIHLACKNGHYDIAAYLLQVGGVDVNIGDASGNYPIHYAAAYGWLTLVKLLMEVGDADPNAVNSWKTSALSIAHRKGHIRVVNYLINNPQVNINFKDSNGRTMLHTCCNISFTSDNKSYESERFIRTIATLLDSTNCDLSIRDINGDTPLHILVASNVHITIQKNPSDYSHEIERSFTDQIAAELQVKIGQMLLDKGAQLEVKNNLGQTALQVALEKDKKPMIHFLIENGANYWDILYSQGLNVLHYFMRAVAEAQSLEVDPIPQTWNEYVVRERESITSIGELLLGRKGEGEERASKVKHLADKVDKNGYTPILLGFLHAINVQYEKFEEKTSRMVKYLDGYEYRYRSDKQSKDGKLESLLYQWDFWIEEAQKFIHVLKPDMNCQLQLPEDFYLKNPKATLESEPHRTGWGLLHFAANLQYSEPLKFFLLNGCNQNIQIHRHNHCQTPLMLASYLDEDNIPAKLLTDEVKGAYNIVFKSKKVLWEESVSILVAGGADPSFQNSEGETSIMIAAIQVKTTALKAMLSHMEVNWEPSKVKECLNKVTYKSHQTALMMAIAQNHYTTAQILIDAGADINVLDNKKVSTLIQILRSQSDILIDYIVSKRPNEVFVDFSLITNEQDTLLTSASALNQTKMVKFLIENAELTVKNTNTSGNVGDLMLVDHMNKENKTALHLACINGNLKLARLLLNCNANPNIHTRDVSDPNFSTPLIEAVKRNILELVQILINSGADIHCIDNEGLSILHHAVNTKNHKIVTTLLEAGAVATVVDRFNMTPLHYICNYSRSQTNKSFKIEGLLLRYGADINAQDYQGRTPLHIAFVETHLIPLMRFTSSTREKAEKYKIMLEKKEANIRELRSSVTKFKLNNSSLESWLFEGLQRKLPGSRKQSWDVCLEDPWFTDGMYRQLHWEKKDSLTSTKDDPIDILRFFLDQKGIELDLKDSFGRTPFHYAAIQGAFTCSTYLLQRKVDVEARDKDELTAFQLGLIYGHVEHCIMLANNGIQCVGEMNVPYLHKPHVSTFHYAMHRSFMPLAYLIMDKGMDLLDAMHDTLSAGQFHLASIILGKAQPIQLLGLNAQKQNIFHVMANFPATTNDWEDYAEEMFDLVKVHSIDINLQDMNGRTPLLIASSNNHNILVKLFLQQKANTDIVDYDGKSALWHAVQEKNIKIAEMILRNGGKPDIYDVKNLESIVSIATWHRDIPLLQMLLNYGALASVETDSTQQNAVMRCILKKGDTVKSRLHLLKIIVDAGGDVNRPCLYKFTKKNPKNESFVTHPIVVALEQQEMEIVKALLKARVRLDVKHPMSNQSPLLMAINHYSEAVLPILESKVSLNDVEPETGRTIFYKCLFEQNWLIKQHLELLWTQHPNLNLVDPITGQTPLEYAIRNNTDLVASLLDFGADPSIKSCLKTTHQLSEKPVNALLHAIMLHNTRAFEILLTHSNGAAKMNIMEVDDEGRSIIHFIVSPYSSVSYNNADMLEKLQQFLKDSNRLRSLINLCDIHEKSPIHYAQRQKSGILYRALLQYGAQPPDNNCMEVENDVEEMSVDSLLTVDVNGDAELQRQKLELEAKTKEEEEAKRLNGGVLPENWNKKEEVDPISHLSQVGKLHYDEDEQPYDILLNKTDVRRGYYGLNMFYKMQIIHNTVQDIYFVWTRWGQIGEQGMHQRTPFNSKEESEIEFRKIFKSKTGNLWEHRSAEEFVEKEGRFVVTRNVYNNSITMKPINFKKCAPSTLPTPLQATIKMFCNVAALREVMLDANADIPLGYLDRNTLEDGFQLLCQIRDAVLELHEAQCSATYDFNVVKAINNRLANLSNRYFMKIPYKNAQLGGIQSITTKELLQNEMRRIDNLRYLNGGANIILAAQLRAESSSPLDYCYKALGCNWGEINKSSEEFLLVNNYMHQSKNTGNYELLHLWSLDKEGESERFQPHKDNSNRMLLWHGSKFSNYLGILSQGLRVAPVEAPATGYMFGKGVYFADMFDKSVAYSTDYNDQTTGYSCLLLCEVALGNMYEATKEKYMETAVDGYQSTKGVGKLGPDFSKAVYTNQEGLIVPQGPVIKRPAQVDANNKKVELVLQYNEYIVYDVSQVRIRYIVLVKDHDYCSLCSKECTTKSLSAFEFSEDSLTGLNAFDQLLATSLLRYESKSLDQIFHERVKDLVVDTKAYERSWKPPTPLSCDSKICNDCSKKLLTLVVFEYIRSSLGKLPVECTSRPDCWYGYKCRTQHKNVIHCSRYNHICIPLKGKDTSSSGSQSD